MTPLDKIRKIVGEQVDVLAKKSSSARLDDEEIVSLRTLAETLVKIASVDGRKWNKGDTMEKNRMKKFSDERLVEIAGKPNFEIDS